MWYIKVYRPLIKPAMRPQTEMKTYKNRLKTYIHFALKVVFNCSRSANTQSLSTFPKKSIKSCIHSGFLKTIVCSRFMTKLLWSKLAEPMDAHESIIKHLAWLKRSFLFSPWLINLRVSFSPTCLDCSQPNDRAERCPLPSVERNAFHYSSLLCFPYYFQACVLRWFGSTTTM